MLDEDEWLVINDLYHKAFLATKEFRQIYNIPFENCSIDERFRPVREKYEEITGYKELNQNAIIHHRISDYGELCEDCGKPLRTSKASFCAACGKVKN